MLKQLRALLGTLYDHAALCLQPLPDCPLVALHEERPFRAASTIKLLVLGELFRRAADEGLDLEEPVTLREEALCGGDGILKELIPGRQYTLRELATLMAIVSDNTAANTLIDRLGMEAVNSYGSALGLRQTRLERRMMDSAAVAAGRENRTSAADLLLFFRKLYRQELPGSAAMLEILKKQQVRGRFERYLPEDAVIAHKTGDLDGLEHDAGLFFTPGRDWVLVVLIDGAPDNGEAQECLARIAQAVYEVYAP